ncbi:hypothetical protein L1987_06113 [Smallanthus sonchifolius]|uniref:Uncharacterized protein n=1 Tax=Smallanthus sonchifolius TaxID=185202 RepID=A0ACB9JX84_9ASTR|nr:hypothetical protein L1987_06113 [Smallanthus sonchifolius]
MKLATLNLINPSNNPAANDFQNFFRNQCEHGFTTSQPRKTKRRRSKRRIDPITGKGKVAIYIKPTTVIHRVKIPLAYDAHQIRQVALRQPDRGAGNARRDEATLFATVVARALKMRADIMTLKKRIGED